MSAPRKQQYSVAKIVPPNQSIAMFPRSPGCNVVCFKQSDRPLPTRSLPALQHYALDVPLAAVLALLHIILVHINDGITRTKVGDRLEYGGVDSVRDWEHSGTDDERPAHPPQLAPGKEWVFVGRDNFGDIVEKMVCSSSTTSANAVVVFREGVALPTRELLRVINTAHAVLLLRGTDEYFYLRNDFVLSTNEEEALVEWGVGRPLLANSVLAVGGVIMVAFAEKVWRPAIVGTLIVAAAEYGVQGVLTKVIRVRSREWKSGHELVPSRIHGTERLVQSVLVTLLALADLLDDRVLLLAVLVCASAQVVLMEYVGQARLTWGYARYNGVLCIQLRVWTGFCAGLVAWLWLAYVFAGVMSCFLLVACPLVLCVMVLCAVLGLREESVWFRMSISLAILGGIGVMISAAVVGWDAADLKFSPQSLQPWRWDFRQQGFFFAVFRNIGLYGGLLVGCCTAVHIVVGLFSFRISNHKTRGVGERTRARKKGGSRGFSHYDEKPIPTRHLLVPDAARRTRDEGTQTTPAPFSSAL